MTIAGGGSIADALKATVFAFAQIGISYVVGPFLNAMEAVHGLAGAALKAVVHGAIGGAISVGQGGTFLQGFAGSAIGSFAGSLADGIATDVVSHTAIVAAAGCAGAVATGGKCAQGAVTAAFANLYNRFGGLGAFKGALADEGPIEEAGGYLPGPASQGHHWFPKSLWPDDLSLAARKVFDRFLLGTSGPLPQGFNLYDKTHVRYNLAVQGLWDDFLHKNHNQFTAATMTSDHARQFLRMIEVSRVPDVMNFRLHIEAGRRMYTFMGNKGTLRMFRPGGSGF
ncbi:MAG: hypothetical protein R3D27_02325 [Hyphomicrobiaceae bacterium]